MTKEEFQTQISNYLPSKDKKKWKVQGAVKNFKKL